MPCPGPSLYEATRSDRADRGHGASWISPPPDLTLRPQELHLWRATTSPSPAELPSAEALLSGDERDRADRFRHARDRTRYIVARAGLRRILGAYLQVDPRTLSLAYSANGKPHLSGAHATLDLQFNLSHSGEWVAYAFALGRAVGVDIERMDPIPDLMAIANRYFAASEFAEIQRLVGASQLEAFYTCWTRKEAYLKARGEGLSYPLSQFAVSVRAGETPGLLANDREPEEVSRWSLHVLHVDDGYVGTGCAEGRPTCTRFFEQSATD